MVVNYEFLTTEPMENVLTFMHYRIDIAGFFGTEDLISSHRESITEFLKKKCGVKKVIFITLEDNDLGHIFKAMCAEVENQLAAGNKLFFDISGGDDVIQVAFGMISNKYEVHVHKADIPNNRVINFGDKFEKSIANFSQKQDIKMDLDSFVKLRCGLINRSLHKDIKDVDDPAVSDDISKIWSVASKYLDLWNPFSEFFRNNMSPGDGYEVHKSVNALYRAMNSSRTHLKSVKKLLEIIEALADVGAFTNLHIDTERISFKFKNRFVKECIWDGGCILELHTCQLEKKGADDCQVGVHLDWDGIINPGEDVLNEIDVMSIRGSIVTFISCKSGNLSGQQVLHALYELDAVAARFGGKYIKKVLMVTHNIPDVYVTRGSEMGIEVKVCR